MNAEQFIEFANNFAKASAKTSSVEIQQAFEDNLDLLARPGDQVVVIRKPCLLYTSPSPRDRTRSRMPSSA